MLPVVDQTQANPPVVNQTLKLIALRSRKESGDQRIRGTAPCQTDRASVFIVLGWNGL